MGKVYKARDPELGRIVAIKIMNHSEEASEREISRFLAEAKITAKLHHPNIVPIHDLGCEAGSNYIVMEFIAGTSLAALIKEDRLSLLKRNTVFGLVLSILVLIPDEHKAAQRSPNHPVDLVGILAHPFFRGAKAVLGKFYDISQENELVIAFLHGDDVFGN